MTVQLLDKQGNMLKQARTNNSGIAKITGVPADEKFRLQFFAGNGEEFTARHQGIDAEKDSDPRPNGTTKKYRLKMGAEVVEYIDAGIRVEGFEPVVVDENGEEEEEEDVINIETPTATSSPPSIRSFRRTANVPEEIVDEELQMEVYPNPTTEKVFVSVSNYVEEDMVLSILDLSGRVILQEEMHFQVGVNTVEIDFGVNKVSQGQLILKLQSPTRGPLIRQFIKQ